MFVAKAIKLASVIFEECNEMDFSWKHFCAITVTLALVILGHIDIEILSKAGQPHAIAVRPRSEKFRLDDAITVNRSRLGQLDPMAIKAV